jgi:hypothetical protein
MRPAPVFAVSTETIFLAEKLLAVVGGAVVGGLIVGLLAQLLMKALTMQKLPGKPLLVLRLLGAVIGGWLVALWVLGGGGAGLGGLGGLGLGSGPGKGGTTPTTQATPKEGTGKHKSGSEAPVVAGETLRIEVLGEEPRKRLGAKADHWYRLDSGEGPHVLTLDEVKEVVKKRQQTSPPLRRIEIVLYKDSPDRRGGLVSQLATWAHDLETKDGEKMKVDFTAPDANAPSNP